MVHLSLIVASLVGCLSSDSNLGSTLGDTLMRTTPEPPGENCPDGGTLLTLGQDTDFDGELDPGEITQSEYLCSGYDRGVPLARATEEPPGENCAEGGTRLDLGTDLDEDGTLDEGEVTETLYVCDGEDGAGGGGFGVPRAVAAGDQAMCGLRSDGRPVCWHEIGQYGPPPVEPLTTLEVINQNDVCGLRADGSVACWSTRQAGAWEWAWTLPSGAFSAWSGHCGLRADGSVACIDGAALPGTYVAMASNACTGFGSPSGQCDWHACGVAVDGGVRCASIDDGGGAAWSVPDGRFKALDLGVVRGPSGTLPWACGIREDDTLACWGSASAPPAGAFASVSVGFNHACALRADGTMACWGGTSPNGADLARAPEGAFRSVSAGTWLTCAQRAAGDVTCWGSCNDDGCIPPTELYLGG
jgi:hypothetical protein